MKCNNPSCEKEAAVKYCCRSCAAKVNNHIKPKRKKTAVLSVCTICSLPCEGTTHQQCSRVAGAQTTLAELHQRLSVSDKHPSWRNSHVRVHNRWYNRTLTGTACQVCGYAKHVELAHIKAVSLFPPEATLEQVNSPDNILVLCRNHHWELDHELIRLEDIPPR